LDTCTTTSTFTSNKHLSDVQTEYKGLAIRCNVGVVRTNRRGNFGGLKVWSMGSGIANVLSLGEITKKHRVTYNSDDGFFVIHTPEGEIYFIWTRTGCRASTSRWTNMRRRCLRRR
jgi:hypothetical protein